jgi:hypothetical protein
VPSLSVLLFTHALPHTFALPFPPHPSPSHSTVYPGTSAAPQSIQPMWIPRLFSSLFVLAHFGSLTNKQHHTMGSSPAAMAAKSQAAKAASGVGKVYC